MGNEQPNNDVRRPVYNRWRLYGAMMMAVALAALFLAQPFAAHSDDALFAPAADSPALDTNSLDAIRRARAVRINWNALSPETEALRLNLFADTNLTAERQRVDRSVTGGYVWVGGVGGRLGDTVTLSVQDGVLSGSVYRSGRLWADIQYASSSTGDVYWVSEVDPSALEPAGPDHILPPQPSQTQMQTSSSQSASCREDGTVVTLLVAYTPEARDAAGGQEAILALINKRISEMNTANDLSGVLFNWELAQAMQVDYAESGSIELDLQNLQLKTDGALDGVHEARDLARADLVSMLISEGSNNSCGFAYQMNATGGYFESYAFGVTALDYADPFSCSDMTLAHEFGHNMGNAHDRDHAWGPVLFDYSYGYQSPNKTFRTIMAYDCPGGCPRINQWSNPDIWYLGEPTGVDFETDPANASDVVRSMNNVRVEVSNFRTDCVDPPPTPTGTPTDVPIPTETPTASATPTETAVPTETSTPTITQTPTATLVPTNTLRPTKTPKGIQPTPTNTLVPTATMPPTRTSRPTPTSEATLPPANRLFLPAVIRK